MFSELESLREKFRQLTLSLSDPATLANPQRFRDLSKERAELEPLIRKFDELQKTKLQLTQSQDIRGDASADPELKTMAEAEVADLQKKQCALEAEIRVLLLPKDPRDERSVILEIRAGAGGDESSLFAQDLFRMYTRFAESKGWKTEVMSSSVSPIGGFKEILVAINGKGVYSQLKYESGVHRVQRVPKTEAAGRIHTSTVTVAVLPEAEEIDLKIDPNDLKIEAFGASGPGGQNVNRNYTAIRITHRPSGLVVSCQDEKSQHRNKEKALRVLRSRLLDIAEREQAEKIATSRKSMVGTGERSEKIRTYNFPQSRVTDHRINQTMHNLEEFLDGKLDSLLQSLVVYYQAQELDRRFGQSAGEARP